MSTVTTPNIAAPTMQQRGPRTISSRKTAVIVGLLFLTATAAFILRRSDQLQSAEPARTSWPAHPPKPPGWPPVHSCCSGSSGSWASPFSCFRC